MFFFYFQMILHYPPHIPKAPVTLSPKNYAVCDWSFPQWNPHRIFRAITSDIHVFNIPRNNWVYKEIFFEVSLVS